MVHNSKNLLIGLDGLAYIGERMPVIGPAIDIGIGAYKVGDAYLHGGDTAKVMLEETFEVGFGIGTGIFTAPAGPVVSFFAVAGAVAGGKIIADRLYDSFIPKNH